MVMMIMKRNMLYNGCKCLLCEQDRMYLKKIQDEFEYKGHKFSHPTEVYWCDTCNDGFYTDESDDFIEEKVKEFWKTIDEQEKEKENVS